MTIVRLLGPTALLLSACASLRQSAAPSVQLRLEATAPEAYNIVWLKATLTNNGPERVLVVAQPDSVDLHCTGPHGVQISVVSPGGDTLGLYQPCRIHAAQVRSVPLAPGAQRTAYLKVNFNYVFPRAVLDTLKSNQASYFNRTMGAYRFGAVYRPESSSTRRQLGRVAGNSVTIRRKE
jgi:hypothetical protein